MVGSEYRKFSLSNDDFIKWTILVLVGFLFLFAIMIFIYEPVKFFQNYHLLSEEIDYELIVNFFIPYLTGFVYLICGVYTISLQKFDRQGQSFAIFTASVSILLAVRFDQFTTEYTIYLWLLMLFLALGSLINLALVFPAQINMLARYTFIRWSGYAIAVPLTIITWFAAPFGQDHNFLSIRSNSLFTFGIVAIIFIIMMIWKWIKSSSLMVREKTKLVILGALLSLAPISGWIFYTAFIRSISFSPFWLFFLVFFPLFTSYAIIHYHLLDADYIFSRTILYVILTTLAVVGYVFLVSGLSLIFGGVFTPTNPLLVGLMVFILTIGLRPIHTFFRKTIDRYFYRSQYDYHEKQQALVREINQNLDLQEILITLETYIQDTLDPEQIHIYIFDLHHGQYAASVGKDGNSTSDIRFSIESSLVSLLSNREEALFLGDFNDLPGELKGEQARIIMLAAHLFIPFSAGEQLIGWLALGNRHSAEPYSARDLDFLEGISSQAAVAIKRIQLDSAMQLRMIEMNVLTRLARGISFTVVFDDTLELISAQTNQILPTRDLHIILIDEETKTLYPAFCLEDDERLVQNENKPLPLGRSLEAEIINSQTALVTSDYSMECQHRGMLPIEHGIYAWMGVPLNAGADTIGVISVGSRDPEMVYAEEQVNLLKVVADLTSGAIAKARLLEESEQRMRQLTMINKIGLDLTSTLELDPLLKNIMANASNLLNCEAGSLFLVDIDTGELVFEVVLGPVAKNLLGSRLAPGTGLVGEAVQTGKAIIANDVKERNEWHEKTDADTGFVTQDLLIVPMRMQDRIIGVIELINNRDGKPFTQNDQELLTAFSSQATIAIENARLYTMTDQALAGRVEELSVMQRIDRELNASLDIERAMRITLNWAIRQAQADAGLVGEVDNQNIRVIVVQGYDDQPLSNEANSNEELEQIIFEDIDLEKILESGKPECIVLSDGQKAQKRGFLEESRQEIVIPIRRETEMIAMILLELKNSRRCSDELLGFLARLSDHAAIAIANAELFEEVKEANLAKSQFVSFVAHELKNPMSSIKGYTELVSGGMAGAVNDMQLGFLGTVSSNVDRMNTIVSDLNDLTKIETGNMRLDFQSVQVREVLDEVMLSLSKQTEENELEIVLKVPKDLPAIWADKSRLNQILTNLISNAQKYTPEEGEIRVEAKREQISDESLGEVEFVHISVQDTGMGISEEDQKSIFQQYFRTDSAKEMASGTGLGLSITKSLIEMQAGSIWFESEVGQGTIFHFTIPIAEVR